MDLRESDRDKEDFPSVSTWPKHLTAHSLSCYSTQYIHRSERNKVTEFTGSNTSPEPQKTTQQNQDHADVLYTRAGECVWERTPAGPGGGNSANWRSVGVIWIEEKSLFEWAILLVYIISMAREKDKSQTGQLADMTSGDLHKIKQTLKKMLAVCLWLK